MATKKRLLISLPHYERIWRTLYSILEGRANTEHACIFFAAVGAQILQHHYKLPAYPVSGAALYLVNATDNVLVSYADIEGDDIVSTSTRFHCWVECQGFVLDFMAPLFERALKKGGTNAKVPARMFQRPLDDGASCWAEFSRDGDFYLAASREATERMIRSFNGQLSGLDLARICLMWYQRPPKKMLSHIDVASSAGEIETIRLLDAPLSGVW